jgi:tetrapyrrole methylase family protein/MazG family protein
MHVLMEKIEKIQVLTDLIQTVHRLRAPGGCAWDRAQTHQTLRQYLIEEAYEVLDVIDEIHTKEDLQKEKIKSAFKEELGDLLMQVLIHSEMTDEEKVFDFYDVARGLNEKLIRRHPHVFGDAQANDEESAFQNWEKEKAKEKASNPKASILDGTPKGLPSLQRVGRVIEKVSKVGFQWKDLTGPVEKLDEELGEFKAEALKLEKASNETEKSAARTRLQEELGDVIFSLCNVAYLMKLNPEDALRGTIHRFESRFRHVEKRLKETGKLPEQSTLQEMDEFWNEAKKLGL